MATLCAWVGNHKRESAAKRERERESNLQRLRRCLAQLQKRNAGGGSLRQKRLVARVRAVATYVRSAAVITRAPLISSAGTLR